MSTLEIEYRNALTAFNLYSALVQQHPHRERYREALLVAKARLDAIEASLSPALRIVLKRLIDREG